MPTMFPVENVDMLVRTGGSTRVNVHATAKFHEGDSVVTVNKHPVTHTRLPQYARGKRGKVVKDHGVFVFPDTNAQLKGENPQHVYSVMFEAPELWGGDVNPRDKLYLDLFEEYLRPAKDGEL